MARASLAAAARTGNPGGIPVNPRYLLPVLAVIFLVLAGYRLLRSGGKIDPRSKSWLMTGVLFAAVSAWLFWKG